VFDWGPNDFNINGELGMNGSGTVLRHNTDNGNVVLSANNPANGVFLRPNGTGSSEGQVYVDKEGRLIMAGSDSDNTAVHMDGSIVLRHNVAQSATVLASNGGDIYLRTAGHNSGTNQAHLYADGTFAAYKMKANEYVDIGGIRFTGKNKVLWNGHYYMSADHQAKLQDQTTKATEYISKQPTGIVLVFSAFDNSSGEPYDYEYSFHFIPKEFVTLHSGKGVALFMHDNAFNYAAQKYLYIYDTYIKGNDQNVLTGTGNTGIKYTNNRYVLRHIIGV
jgi:hypothetical protein